MALLVSNVMTEKNKHKSTAKIFGAAVTEGRRIQRVAALPQFMARHAETPQPTVFLIAHDHLRKAIDTIAECIPKYTAVVDEIHKASALTSQRTGATHRLTSAAFAWLA
jgi:hypothetical protein